MENKKATCRLLFIQEHVRVIEPTGLQQYPLICGKSFGIVRLRSDQSLVLDIGILTDAFARQSWLPFAWLYSPTSAFFLKHQPNIPSPEFSPGFGILVQDALPAWAKNRIAGLWPFLLHRLLIRCNSLILLKASFIMLNRKLLIYKKWPKSRNRTACQSFFTVKTYVIY